MYLQKIIASNSISSGSLYFNDNNLLLAHAKRNVGICIWSINSYELRHQLDICSNYQGTIVFSPSGDALIGVNNSGQICQWTFANKRWLLSKTMQTDRGIKFHLQIHNDENQIAFLNFTHSTAELWNIHDQIRLKSYPAHSAALNPIYPLIAIKDASYIKLINYIEDKLISRLYIGDDYTDMVFTSDGSSLIAINDSGEIVVTDLVIQNRTTLTSKSGFARKFATGDSILAVLYESGRICMWDLNTAKIIDEANSTFYQVDTIAISGHMNLLAVGGGHIDAGKIELWNLDNIN